jgi:hypothetical protein
MGVEPFLVASSINLIMAQRLVRVICANCKEESPLTPEALIDIGTPPDMAEQVICYRGVGCANCNGTGYKGRLALYEVMPMADPIREAVIAGASTAEVKRTAISQRHVHAPPERHQQDRRRGDDGRRGAAHHHARLAVGVSRRSAKTMTTSRCMTLAGAKAPAGSSFRLGMSLAPCEGLRRYVPW